MPPRKLDLFHRLIRRSRAVRPEREKPTAEQSDATDPVDSDSIPAEDAVPDKIDEENAPKN